MHKDLFFSKLQSGFQLGSVRIPNIMGIFLIIIYEMQIFP